MSDGELRPEVLLGHTDGEHISIRVLGRMHAGTEDYWDGNWLVTPVRVVAGGFRAESGAALRAEELRRFREALEQLHGSLQGEAVLESMEEWLTVRLNVDRAGHVAVSGKVRDRLGSGNELTFKINDLDQSDLPGVIEALNEVETFFPVVGTP